MANKSISLFLLLFAGLSLVAVSASAARIDQSYVDTLIQEAGQKKLAHDRYWHILLHYQQTVFGVKSLIDDPRFFLSKEGAHNPQAELAATLRAFFAAPDDPENPPVCRFIARYAWLKEKLRFDESKLPVSKCAKFNKTIAVIKPKSASLVFPASYLNNPASMFGHTLISIETEQKSKLLAHAVNYSAFTTEKNGLVFALKGLSGFYKGYYSILPYYQKVQEYNDLNQRDIWEYPLNFTEEEVKKMVMHIWELQGIYSFYYFFDENCSYNILFLLEAGRPSLNLTDQFYGWVIPLDTIRILERQGAIAASDYRPSKATKIKYLASLLDPEQQQQALELSRGIVEPEVIINQQFSEQEKIRVLDLATEYLQYLYVKKELAKDRYTVLFLKLLKARSSLGKTLTAADEPPVPPYPDKGHASSRFGLGFGIKKGSWFEEIRFRFAYHTLIDFPAGYDNGSHIQFLNTALRYYSAKDKWELKSLDVIDIISLSPRDLFFKPISWKVKTGWRQTLLGDGDDHLVYQLNIGGGFAYSNKFLGLYYGMLEGDINLSGALKENYALGIGASVGTKKNIAEWWTMLLGAKALYYGPRDEHKTYELSLKHNFAISAHRSLSLEVLRSKTFGIYETDAVFMWNLYF